MLILCILCQQYDLITLKRNNKIVIYQCMLLPLYKYTQLHFIQSLNRTPGPYQHGCWSCDS